MCHLKKKGMKLVSVNLHVRRWNKIENTFQDLATFKKCRLSEKATQIWQYLTVALPIKFYTIVMFENCHQTNCNEIADMCQDFALDSNQGAIQIPFLCISA